MIKQIRASYFANFKNAQYCALSTDQIPDYLENGDEVYMIDTGKNYIWDAISSDLYEDKSSSGGAVDDVQIDGTSIVSNGVAIIPIATDTSVGLVRGDTSFGTGIYNQRVFVSRAYSDQIKAGTQVYKPITPSEQHTSTFYGLAKAAGHDEKDSTLALGTYTEEAKNAIRAMLGVTDSAGGMNVVTLTGTNITRTAAENTMYKCGELAELTFTPPVSGITAVRFSSGSTPTVASFPGVTWLGDFDPDDLLSNVTYEINILDGVGVAGWA